MTENDFRKELNKRANNLSKGECIIHLEQSRDKETYNIFTGDIDAIFSVITSYLMQIARSDNDRDFERALELIRVHRKHQLDKRRIAK
jgi:hypothetical protein